MAKYHYNKCLYNVLCDLITSVLYWVLFEYYDESCYVVKCCVNMQSVIKLSSLPVALCIHSACYNSEGL
jgi:hypothetical protein